MPLADAHGRDGPALRLDDGQLELLKWLALASMVLDHVGRLWLERPDDGWVFAGGRLAFPLFALVLGLKLGRPGDQAGRAARTARRLALWCAVAIVPSILARGHPTLINVLGTLALGAVLCWVFAASPRPALCLLLAVPALALAQSVEFGLPGVLIVPMAWQMQARRDPAAPWLLLLLVALVGLDNARTGGLSALAATLMALPLASLVGQLPVRVPRLGRAFYVFYPVHLAVIGLIDPPARWL